MLSFTRLTLFGNLQRLATPARTLRSVVPATNVDDFTVENEPILGYLPGSKERAELEQALKEATSTCAEVPIIIGGKEYKTDNVQYQVMPHNHKHKIAKFYYADKGLLEKAINVAVDTQKNWERVPIKERIAIWLKGADMMANQGRMKLNAATMLGQSKNALQAEIDSACELIDFIRFNAFFAKEATKFAPLSPEPNVSLNSMRYRGLDGFVASVTPFNFTAIGGNLAFTPALMGCTTLWKPSDTAVLSNYEAYKIMVEAGVPPGVVNFVPADGPVFGDTVTKSAYLAGINFTGSVPTFNRLWTQVGANINNYINYPRLIGECGGKNFHMIHPSANVESVAHGTIRSAFEYNGQKCSACSRMYVPKSMWPKLKDQLLDLRNQIKMGDPTEYDTLMGAVIDEKAYKRISGYIDHASKSNEVTLLGGGKSDNKIGYFIEPTIVETKNPLDKLMREEIFGPVLTIFVYDDKDLDRTMDLVRSSTPFALTGAIYAEDEGWLKSATEELKYAAGNFYVNDKSTGSVVGQQPFGGSKMSGTNDKAGGPHYVLRWASPQSIKETFVPLKDFRYPYMKP